MKKRACSLFLALAVMLSLTAVPAGAAESPVVSRNRSAQDYTTWSKPVNSYLFENGASGLTRVRLDGQVADYDTRDEACGLPGDLRMLICAVYANYAYLTKR